VTTVALALYFQHRTADALPWSDAATTAASLAGQWMTTRKWLESWVVWIGVDAVYVAMYVSQRLHPTAVLYAVFLVMAVLGYREWRSSMQAAR
jgi:nicotinamide mononucleotide transporter